MPIYWDWNNGLSNPAMPNGYTADMCWDPVRKETICYTRPNSGSVPETWRLKNGVWSQLSPAHSPPDCFYHRLCWDPVNEVIAHVNGYDTSSNEHDAHWEWDGTDWTLRNASIGGGGRSWQSFFEIDPVLGKGVVMGIWGGGARTYELDCATRTWTRQWPTHFPVRWPPNQCGCMDAFDAVNNRVLIFYETTTGDHWEWYHDLGWVWVVGPDHGLWTYHFDTHDWEQLSCTFPSWMTARDWDKARLVYAPNRYSMFLIGCRPLDGGEKVRICELDLTAGSLEFVERSCTNADYARSAGAAAIDGNMDALVWYGGYSPYIGEQDETWQLALEPDDTDGPLWTPIYPAAGAAGVGPGINVVGTLTDDSIIVAGWMVEIMRNDETWETAYVDGGGFSAGWQGSASAVSVIPPHGYQIILDPTNDFKRGTQVYVRVTAEDEWGNQVRM